MSCTFWFFLSLTFLTVVVLQNRQMIRRLIERLIAAAKNE